MVFLLPKSSPLERAAGGTAPVVGINAPTIPTVATIAEPIVIGGSTRAASIATYRTMKALLIATLLPFFQVGCWIFHGA